MSSYYIAQLDTPLFCMLYKRYRGMSYAVALRILRNRHDAEDVAQSAWERIITHFPIARKHWSGDQSVFEAWLTVVVRNLAKDELRKKKILAAALERRGWRPGARTEAQEEYQEAIGEIRSMPDRSRAVLEQRLIYERRFKEIGQSLGCSEDAARMRHNRALGALRARLWDEDEQ